MTDEKGSGPLEYGPPTRKPAVSALSIISVVIGGLSFPLDYALMAGVVTGFAALILGIVGVRRSTDRMGRILGIIGIILSSLAMLVGITCGALLFGSLSGMRD